MIEEAHHDEIGELFDRVCEAADTSGWNSLR